jgi:hypothetical protein
MIDLQLPELVMLAKNQAGIVRRDQLNTLPLSPAFVRAQLDARRWRPIGPLLIAVHNGPLTSEQQLWAAVLNAGPMGSSALCGRTAAQCAGLKGWATELIEVVVPRGARIPRLPELRIRLHESRRFAPTDLHPTRLPPQTTIERAAIDIGAWSRDARSACGVLAAVVQQRLTTPEQLRGELDRAGRVRHHRIMGLALLDIAGGAQALSEIDLGRLCQRFGLPAPERQVVRRERNGRKRYVDASWRRSDGRWVRVEVDGALHLLVETYWDDMNRSNEMTVDGEIVLRFPAIALRLDPARVADQIARALGLSELAAAIAT